MAAAPQATPELYFGFMYYCTLYIKYLNVYRVAYPLCTANTRNKHEKKRVCRCCRHALKNKLPLNETIPNWQSIYSQLLENDFFRVQKLIFFTWQVNVRKSGRMSELRTCCPIKCIWISKLYTGEIISPYYVAWKIWTIAPNSNQPHYKIIREETKIELSWVWFSSFIDEIIIILHVFSSDRGLKLSFCIRSMTGIGAEKKI